MSAGECVAELPVARAIGRLLPVTLATALAWTLYAAALGVAVVLRVWNLDALGYNSDEAVYAGQAASIAGVPELTPFFPIFRAHPLLFQTIHSLGYLVSQSDLVGRLLASAFGLGTVALVFAIARRLYGLPAAAVASLVIALMPYHVVVSRQVLLDGPTAFFATLSLYFVVRYSLERRPALLYVAGGAMGLSVLSKETSILIVGGAYAFFTLSPELGARLRHLLIALGVMLAVISIYPVALKVAGHASTGGNYLAYQLFRRPNHGWLFYPETVTVAMGPLVLAAAGAGLWLLRGRSSWRETLLLCWIAVPAAFFQLYPVKGFQYLLPAAPAVAILAGRTLACWRPARHHVLGGRLPSRWLASAATVAVLLSLALPTWERIQPRGSTTFLAGAGGVPGGREVGRWIRTHVPQGAEMLAIGPSMANILQFYGHRRAYGLSVGTNPLRRNPAYDPLPNPDRAIRTNEVQYVVWDAFSAARTPFFANKLLQYVRRYNGRAVRTESVATSTRTGAQVRRPLIIVYAVRP